MFKKIKNPFSKKPQSEYDQWQEEEIQSGKSSGVDVSVYSYSDLYAGYMKQARLALEEGASKKAVAFLIQKIREKEISREQYESLIKQAIYILDLEELIERYQIEIVPEEEAKQHQTDVLYGSTFGDMIGSDYEFCLDFEARQKLSTKNAITMTSNYTDDTVLTCATAYAMTKDFTIRPDIVLDDYQVHNSCVIDNPYTEPYIKFTKTFRMCGYGPGFIYWVNLPEKDPDYALPYGSLGNGSAMRVSPIGAYFEDQKDVISHAVISAFATHNHPEGVKGAAVTAMAVWMAIHGYSKKQIYEFMKKCYHGIYGFSEFSLSECRNPKKPGKSDATCMFSVPASIICFYDSDSYEDTINHVLHLEGDTDTMGAIAGAIAGAYYGFPENLKPVVQQKKPKKIWDCAYEILKGKQSFHSSENTL